MQTDDLLWPQDDLFHAAIKEPFQEDKDSFADAKAVLLQESAASVLALKEDMALAPLKSSQTPSLLWTPLCWLTPR